MSSSASQTAAVFPLTGNVTGTQTVKMLRTSITRARRARAPPLSSGVITATVCSAAGYVTEIMTVATAAMSGTVQRPPSAVPAGSGSAPGTACVLTSAGCATTPRTVPMERTNPPFVVSLDFCVCVFFFNKDIVS